MGSEIIVCGKRYDIGHRVVTFEDEDGYSSYVPHRTDRIDEIYASHPSPGLANRATRYRFRRLIGRDERIENLSRLVRQVVIHLDGCRDARMCFNVLHNDRGLSVHFMIDNDGTIYQCLDLLHCAFHAGGVNEVSVGIEMQNRGDAARYPNYYPAGRDTVTCRVHGHQFLCYDFTEAQYEGMTRLGAALTRLLAIPLVAPSASGKLIRTTIDNPRHFTGFIGHYHVSANKWDPGPFDFGRLFRGIGANVTFPLSKPLPPSKATAGAISRIAARYHDNAEQDAELFFPVGPLGRSRLWHGGVHLQAPLGQPVRAMLTGTIVAARFGLATAVGSTNFVLLRHRTTIGDKACTLFSLYYHLAVDEVGSSRLRWIQRARNDSSYADLESGVTALLGVDVEAGETLGTVGEAGPEGDRSSQIHFAVFSSTEISAKADPGSWEIIDPRSPRSRLCDDARILRRIDRSVGGRPPDGALSRRELRNFFRLNVRREELRRVVVRHLSEWTPGQWATELARAPDFARLPASRRQRLFESQVKPTLWWTRRVARHCGLPTDGVIYSYHPIGFIVWLAQMMARRGSAGSAGIDSAERWQGQMAPKRLTVDAESGEEMTDAEDYYSGEHGKQLTLEDLVNGYPDEQ